MLNLRLLLKGGCILKFSTAPSTRPLKRHNGSRLHRCIGNKTDKNGSASLRQTKECRDREKWFFDKRLLILEWFFSFYLLDPTHRKDSFLLRPSLLDITKVFYLRLVNNFILGNKQVQILSVCGVDKDGIDCIRYSALDFSKRSAYDTWSSDKNYIEGLPF